MAIDTPIHTNEQSIDRVLNAGLPVLLVFWRDDTRAKEQLDSALNRLAASYAGKALVAKVNVKDNPALAKRYSVAQLPALVFTKNGSVVAQGSGTATEASLGAWFEHLIAGGPRPNELGTPQASSQNQSNSSTTHATHARQQTATAEASAHPITLSDASFDQVVGRSDKPVLVDFWAPWCGPCRMVAPAVEQMAREFAGRAVVAKLNVDDNPRLAERFNVQGIPALLIFKRGKLVERLVGAQPAAALRQALTKHAS